MICKHCKVKEIPPVAIKHGDPFCSTECAKEFNGVLVPINYVKKNDIEHGTLTGYVKSRCRCLKCRTAWSDYKKTKKQGCCVECGIEYNKGYSKGCKRCADRRNNRKYRARVEH